MGSGLQLPVNMAARTVQTRQTAAIIDGVHTEVLCSSYQDRIFVLVTQFEKVGTLISISKISGQGPSNTNTFNTKVLLGNDEEIWHVYAKQVGAMISEHSNKPVLLGIALKKNSQHVLKQILSLLQSSSVW